MDTKVLRCLNTSFMVTILNSPNGNLGRMLANKTTKYTPNLMVMVMVMLDIAWYCLESIAYFANNAKGPQRYWLKRIAILFDYRATSQGNAKEILVPIPRQGINISGLYFDSSQSD